jgi:voltage-gated potassium channel
MYNSASAIVDFEFVEPVQAPSDQHRKSPPHKIYTEPSATLVQEGLQERSLLSQRTNILVTFAGVILLIVQLIQLEDPVGLDFVEVLDSLVCGVLLADFIYDFTYANSRRQFLKKRWWELLASIPIVDTGQQAVLMVRLLRIIRLFRLVKLRHELTQYYRNGYDILKRHRVIDISSIVCITILGGSLGFFYVEQGVNPHMDTYADSLWWALVTVTTIGYGDIYPVTNAGRLVASMMMIVGIGCVSILTGTIASNLLKDCKCPHCGGDV